MDDGIEIAVIGEVDGTIVEGVRDMVSKTFDTEITISATSREPYESAYDGKRGQYSAPLLLHCINLERRGSMKKTLGILDRDIYLPEFKYVFGFSDDRKSAAVVSLARLRGKSEMPGRSRKPLERAIKTSVHELGHIYGLSHCRDHRCVMFLSFNLSDTDYKGKDFCPPCSRVLDKSLFSWRTAFP